MFSNQNLVLTGSGEQRENNLKCRVFFVCVLPLCKLYITFKEKLEKQIKKNYQ